MEESILYLVYLHTLYINVYTSISYAPPIVDDMLESATEDIIGTECCDVTTLAVSLEGGGLIGCIL